uniref:Uncharacterized protein n=1 Tax=Ananas comosus var. bracteatus TaxID=296719 RepID=A0A6V7Q7Z1_ANACO|nr:unnamed protein product [Ananas comosus var. bracteatus]
MLGMDGGRDLRRSVTLSDQLAAGYSSSSSSNNLRDLLKVRDDGDNNEIRHLGRRASVAGDGSTLASAIAAEKAGVSDGGAAGAGPSSISSGRSRAALPPPMPTLSFKDRLRIGRTGAAAFASSATAAPISDPELVPSLRANPNPSPGPGLGFPRSLSIRPFSAAAQEPSAPGGEEPDADSPVGAPANPSSTARFRSFSIRPPAGGEEEAESPPPPPVAAEEEEQPVRVSLMALLEQTDRQWAGGDGAEGESPVTATALAAAAEGEEEAEEEDGGDDGDAKGVCTTCAACAWCGTRGPLSSPAATPSAASAPASSGSAAVTAPSATDSSSRSSTSSRAPATAAATNTARCPRRRRRHCHYHYFYYEGVRAAATWEWGTKSQYRFKPIWVVTEWTVDDSAVHD